MNDLDQLFSIAFIKETCTRQQAKKYFLATKNEEVLMKACCFSFSEDSLKLLASDIEKQNGIIPCEFLHNYLSHIILAYCLIPR